jgi:hypothetical protein
MKTKQIIIIFVAVMLIALIESSFSNSTDKIKGDNDDWILLGSQTVDYTLDRDVVSLKESGAFTALKFKVNNGSINLHNCTVHFKSGETQEVSFSTNVNDGRSIDLYGNTRKIEKITFWYDTEKPADKKAVVEVWGKK